MTADFVRTRLFKPFVSTKDGGFGIGAFEARELIRAMGGRLEVESREGAGTRFTIYLPLRRRPPALIPTNGNAHERCTCQTQAADRRGRRGAAGAAALGL